MRFEGLTTQEVAKLATNEGPERGKKAMYWHVLQKPAQRERGEILNINGHWPYAMPSKKCVWACAKVQN